jgi:hypothetical protein
LYSSFSDSAGTVGEDVMRTVVLRSLIPLVLSSFAAQAAIIHSEGFESGFNGYAPSTLTGDGANTWVLNPGFGPGANSGSGYAGVNSANSQDHVLTSPLINTTGLSGIQLRFFHDYNLESTFDGGTIEVAVDGGAFAYVPDSNFIQNGYNGVCLSCPNAVDAFNGNRAYLESIVNLDSFLAGSNFFQFRFRRTTDLAVQLTGWFVDDITVESGIPEPTTFVLFGAGLLALGALRRKG